MSTVSSPSVAWPDPERKVMASSTGWVCSRTRLPGWSHCWATKSPPAPSRAETRCWVGNPLGLATIGTSAWSMRWLWRSAGGSGMDRSVKRGFLRCTTALRDAEVLERRIFNGAAGVPGAARELREVGGKAIYQCRIGIVRQVDQLVWID